MSVGKRLSTDEPLTEHDVAERLDKAAMRLVRILTDARQLGMAEAVKSSRYLAGGMLEGVAAELAEWGVIAVPVRCVHCHQETPDHTPGCTIDPRSRWTDDYQKGPTR